MPSSFADIRLPEDIEQGAKGGPNFMTSIVQLSGGVEQRIATWDLPLASWDIGYGIQEPEDFAPVEDFFYARRAQAVGFRFKDWHDFQCTGELLGTGDGTLRTFLMVKTYGDDAGTVERRITRPVDGTINVYVDGTLADPANYDAHTPGGWIRFHTGHAPGNGLDVTFDCEFDVPVRFNVDDFQMVLYWIKAGEIPSIPVVEIRDIVNAAPTIALTNTTSTLSEGASTVTHTHVADVVITDDPFGENSLSLSGADADSFELIGTLSQLDGTGVALYLKSGVSLNADLKGEFDVTVDVTDAQLSIDPSAHVDFALTITPVERAPTVTLSGITASFVWNQDTSVHLPVATVNVAQVHPTATANTLALSGADATDFELGVTTGTGGYTTTLYIKAGTPHAVDAMTPLTYNVSVDVSNADFSSPPQDSATLAVTFGVTAGTNTFDTPGDDTFTVPFYQTLVIEGWAGGGGAPGTNTVGADGTDTTITAMSLAAVGGKCPALTTTGTVTGLIGFAGPVYNTLGGAGGTASGGDTNSTGAPGGIGTAKQQIPAAGTVVGGAGGAATDGGAGGAGGSASAPAAPYSGSNCSGAPPSPYPVPGTVNSVDGANGAGPGDGGGGCGVADWEVVLALATGYCWFLYGQGRPGGGAGGKFTKTFVFGVTAGAPNPGDVISFHVGAKGVGGQDTAKGGDGGHARIKFTVS